MTPSLHNTLYHQRIPLVLGRFGLALIALLLFHLTAFVSLADTATNVSGTISTNTTWTLARSPYILSEM